MGRQGKEKANERPPATPNRGAELPRGIHDKSGTPLLHPALPPGGIPIIGVGSSVCRTCGSPVDEGDVWCCMKCRMESSRAAE